MTSVSTTIQCKAMFLNLELQLFLSRQGNEKHGQGKSLPTSQISVLNIFKVAAHSLSFKSECRLKTRFQHFTEPVIKSQDGSQLHVG